MTSIADRERTNVNIPGVTRIAGTCSTYVVSRDGRGLAIDCGQLSLEDATRGTGVDEIDRLLLTHFHRDQCGRAAEWAKEGVRVGFPFAERRFYEEGDVIRAGYDTYDNYKSYYPTSGPVDDIEGVALVDYDRVVWQDVEVQVIPLPGHTFGSVGYLFEVNGQRLFACGDLMASPGKLHEYYSSQWAYMTFQGHVNLIESLETVRNLAVDWILPGHGEPFEAEDTSFTDLQVRLAELYELFYATPYEAFKPIFRQMSDHVFEVSNSSAYTYIVRDDDGHGLFIDSGYVGNAPITSNPHRYIDHLTPTLESEIGVTDVEWFLPSHYHDDHLAGLPALQIKYDTKVATSPEVADIIEHPERYDMPCLVPYGTKVDRVVGREEVFAWRGIDFRIEQYPGQTWYHNLITFDVDGKRYLSIGDNVSGLTFRESRDWIHSFIPKNRTPVTSYRDMPRQIQERNPDTILTGHGGGVPHNPAEIEKWQTWMDRWTELFTDIIDQPHPNLGMDPHWVEFYPFKVRVKPGDDTTFEIRVRNHEPEARTGSITLVTTDGIEVSPERFDIDVGVEETRSFDISAKMPMETRSHSWTIVADVTWNGKHLGGIAEAVCYW